MAYGSAEDVEAIHAVVRSQLKGAQDGDASRAATGYADDADWINAFRVRRRGRVEIEAWMARHIADAGYRRAQRTARPPEVRFIRDDGAVVHSYLEVIGQVLRGGVELPLAKVHNFRVMSKENGQWLIVSHIIMDEKDVPRSG